MPRPTRTARRYLMLRGVFLMTQAELDWFYGGGAGRFFPDLWARFTDPIPEDERGDLIAAYHRRLFSGDVAEETRHARAWAPGRTRWPRSNIGAAATARRTMPAPSPGWRITISSTADFLEKDGQILRDMGRIAASPA
jgi:proline iminopeptidase